MSAFYNWQISPKMLLSIGGYAGMAELADAQDLGSCAFGVQVQALLPAPKKREVKPFFTARFFICVRFGLPDFLVEFVK